MNSSYTVANNKLAIKKRRWILQLYQEFDHICYLYGLKLRRPTIDLSTASSYWGSYDHLSRQITLNVKLIELHPWQCVIEILKHEISHQIVFEHFQVNDSGHGEDFQKACDLIGISHWARRASGSISESLEVADEALQHPYAEKVKKLLKLAQSNSNEQEALLAMQRARAICLKYGLDPQTLDESSSQGLILHFDIIYTTRKRLERYHAVIGSLLQEHFLVDVVFSSSYHAEDFTTYKTIEIFGSHENVRIAVYVYHFILNQLPLLWQVYQQSRNVEKKHRTAYYMGILKGFESKLGDRHEVSLQNANEASQSVNSKVLSEAVKRHLAVYRKKLDDYLRKRHPKLHSRRWSHSGYDLAHYQNGVRRGKELNLHAPLASQSKKPSPRPLLSP